MIVEVPISIICLTSTTTKSIKTVNKTTSLSQYSICQQNIEGKANLSVHVFGIKKVLKKIISSAVN